MTQDEALKILKTGANVFLTGEPGSGKTHTVNAYVSWLREHGIEPAITASTGIAATHIGGLTIHSWSGIGIAENLSERDVDAIAGKEHVARRIIKSRILIIDEVSMLSGETLRMVEAVVREVFRGGEVFGGMQVVFVGDFFQLPPVSRGANRSRTSFAFESSVWKELNPIVCYLTEQHRQEDATFLSALASIRSGSADEESLFCLQERTSTLRDVSSKIPRLFAHNADVDRINADALSKLPGTPVSFAMTAEGPDALVGALKRGCLSPENLLLKKDAVVMCTKNNPSIGFANGTLGVVTGFDASGYPIVKTKGGSVLTIEPMEWVVEQEGRVRARISQVPLRLAWAMTIHKSQGMSMDAAAIDLSGVFEHGHGYVALSRVRTLSGLHLLGWSERALLVHPNVAKADQKFRSESDDAEMVFESMNQTERVRMEENFIRACGGTLEKKKVAKGAKEKATTYDKTLALIQEGLSLDKIIEARGLTLGTLVDHIEKLIAKGRCTALDVQNMFPPELLEALPVIHTAFKEEETDRLSPVFKRLKGKYTFDELKIARLFFPAV
ncbi:MAG: helix-turn-helix domain-containing protein [Patescibacteria group bacterium]